MFGDMGWMSSVVFVNRLGIQHRSKRMPNMDENSPGTSAAPAGWYENPSGAEKYRWWDGSRWTEQVTDNVTECPDEHEQLAAVAQAVQSEQVPTASSDVAACDYPVIRNWKSAMFFSFLGIMTNCIIWELIAVTLGPFFAALIQTVLVVVYGAVFYRTYFTDKPLIRSCRTISFLNYAVSGILFGWYWNVKIKWNRENLKIKQGGEKLYLTAGASLAIFAILFSLVTLYFGWYQFFSPYAYIPQDHARSYSSSLQGSEAASTNTGTYLSHVPGSSRFTDEESGVSFSIPDGWHQEELTEKRRWLRWKACPDNDKAYISVTYGASEGNPDMTDVPADAFKGMLSQYLDGCTDETVEKVTLGGTEYWKIAGSGTQDYNGTTFPISAVILMRAENGTGYQFQYFDYGSPVDTSAYYNDFEALVTSATYR